MTDQTEVQAKYNAALGIDPEEKQKGEDGRKFVQFWHRATAENQRKILAVVTWFTWVDRPGIVSRAETFLVLQGAWIDFSILPFTFWIHLAQGLYHRIVPQKLED